MTIGAHLPTRIVAVDDRLWGDLSDDDRRRLRDRLSMLRSDLLLIAIGDSPPIGDLLEADYRLARSGEWTLRLPAQEEIANAPHGPLGSSIRHLAEEFLIMPSSVTLLLGPDLPLPDPDQSWLVARLPAGQEDLALEAFDRLLASPTRRRGRSLRRRTRKGRRVPAQECHSPRLHRCLPGGQPSRTGGCHYASVWARDGVITGLWRRASDTDSRRKGKALMRRS